MPVLAGAEKLNAEPAVVDVVPNPPNPPNYKGIIKQKESVVYVKKLLFQLFYK